MILTRFEFIIDQKSSDIKMGLLTIVKSQFYFLHIIYFSEFITLSKAMTDTFGFQNQGKNYGKFRPKYPQTLYSQTVKSLCSKEKYLDIAMGTGQLLFNIAPYFQSSKGTDISDKMLDAAKAQLTTDLANLNSKIQIQKCNVLSLPENQKFDLITIGQALHWLPIRESLQKIKKILNPDGRVLMIGYIVKGLQDENQDKVYQQFYELTKETKPQFCFNRDELHEHYKNKEEYPFEQYFKKVLYDSEVVKVSMPKSAYISYMKTYAGYNLLMAKKAFSQDPMISVQEGTRGESVTVIIDYFKVQCWN